MCTAVAPQASLKTQYPEPWATGPEHTPGHVPESGHACGGTRGAPTPLSSTDPCGFGGSANPKEERAIDAGVIAAEVHLSTRSTTPTGTVDSSRSATEGVEEDTDGDWHGTIPQQPQVKAPCGACGRQIIDRQRFTFAGWFTHTECVVENVRVASGRGDDWLGVAIRGGNELPRRRTFRHQECCQGSTNDMMELRSGVRIDGDS